MLAKVEEMKKTVVKNKDVVKKEIGSHFELTISFLTSCKEKLLKSVDVKTSDDLNLLNSQVNDLQTYIQNMVEYKANFQNEDPQERLLFILYGVCSIDDIIPEKCPPFINPGILKYLEGCLENPLMQKISGDVCKRFENTKLLREGQLVKNIDLLQEKIESLSFDSGLFWVFSLNKTAFCKYDQEGNCVDTIQVNIHRFKNQPFCVVDNDGVRAIFRSETHKALMIKDSCKKIFIDVSPFAVTCMCLTRDCEILAGLSNSKENYFGIAIYSIEGVRKQFITQVMKKWSREPLLSGNSFRPYIVENVNGDICLSVETNLSKVVNVIRPNGDHRFTYEGKGTSFLFKPFLPRGICTNVFGQILIADENNHGIHVLDKDGGFLTMLNIPGEPRVIPISLCIDHQNNLCIGCADGKIRILKYLE